VDRGKALSRQDAKRLILPPENPLPKPAAGAARLPDDFDTITDSAERKRRFEALVVPLARRENRRLASLRHRVSNLVGRLDHGRKLAAKDTAWLERMARDYRVTGSLSKAAAARAELLEKVDIVPVSLTLAQAANESAWGQSRFAREGQNLFGIWTYDPDKGIVPRNRADGATHLVRRFDDLSEAVRFYMHTLNSHPAYAKLRKIRAQLRAAGETVAGSELAAGLARYSARGEAYVRDIKSMIADNGLDHYDSLQVASL
jgi:Bax protein